MTTDKTEAPSHAHAAEAVGSPAERLVGRLAPERAIAMAAKLYEARRASRFILGETRWREHMQFIGEAIKLCQARTGMDTIQAAMKMCERCHAYGGPATDSVHILSAAVELVEPSEPPNVEFSGVPAGYSSNHPAGGTSAGTQG